MWVIDVLSLTTTQRKMFCCACNHNTTRNIIDRLFFRIWTVFVCFLAKKRWKCTNLSVCSIDYRIYVYNVYQTSDINTNNEDLHILNGHLSCLYTRRVCNILQRDVLTTSRNHKDCMYYGFLCTVYILVYLEVNKKRKTGLKMWRF